MIDKNCIERVCALSSLSFSSAEKEELADDLFELISFVDKINSEEAPSSNAPVYPHENVNVFREDIPAESLCRESLLSSAPTVSGGYITVPLVSWEAE